MNQEAFKIVIGPRWSFFSYPRDDLQLLGTVQRGLQIGALGLLPDGNYVQVNGDVISPLNSSRVLFALRASHGRAAPPPAQTAPAPVVIVKKRRRILLPSAAE